MASAFNLTAQLQLQAPTNTTQVINQVRNQLSGANVQLQVQANAQSVNQVNQALQQTTKSANAATKASKSFASALTSAAKRFSIFAGATGVLFAIGNAFKRSAKDALAFEETLRKVTQITGKSSAELGSLVGTINKLSTTLGVASGELLNVAKTLSQAGFSARDTERALNVLAKTTLTSSFDDIIQTTEGAIAILRQFEAQARATGDDILFLERTLGAINQVSKKFAVESSDIIAAIRRTGGVFAAAGGEVEELIALFTSVRATTRETAETIATGLRTIFTRLQRTDTVDALKALGIELRTLDGAFVGPFEAIQRIQRGLAGLDPRDFRFAEIVEELGGIRQIGKLIPLIQANTVAQRAYNEARRGGNSINDDAATTQDLLSRRIRETGERFDELIRKFTASQGFRDLAEAGFKFADALIKITESIIPLIPLITQLLTVTATVGIGKFALGKFGIGGKNSGGKIHKFARGGFVPGTGNSDTVPAMLQPGEFVIKKSSAQSLGANTLHAMNNNRFQDGGLQKKLSGKGVSGQFTLAGQKDKKISAQAIIRAAGDKDGDNELDIGAAFLQPVGINRKTQAAIDTKPIYEAIVRDMGRIGNTASKANVQRAIGDIGNQIKIGITSGSLDQGTSVAFQGSLKNAMANFASDFAKREISSIPFNVGKFSRAYKKINLSQVEGGIFEAFVTGLSDAPFDNQKIAANERFDFPGGLGAAGSIFNVAGYMPADAKRTFNEDALVKLASKGSRLLVEGFRSQFAGYLQETSPTGAKGVEEARLKAMQAPALKSKLKPPQARHLGGIIQRFAEGGDVASPKQLSFINSLLSQYQKAVGSPHPNSSFYGDPELEKRAASPVIDKLKKHIRQAALIKKYAGNAAFRFNEGYGEFMVSKSQQIGRPQQRKLEEFGGNTAKIEEYFKSGERGFSGSLASSPKTPGPNSATMQTRTRYGYGGRRRYAAGGSAGTDTVPALLTPGEYVINKSAAQSIGYGNLNSMNETGVARFATGGAVGVQRFAEGGGPVGYLTKGTHTSAAAGASDAAAKAIKAYTAATYKQIRAQNQSLTAIQALNMARRKVEARYAALAASSQKVTQSQSGIQTAFKKFTTSLSSVGTQIKNQASKFGSGFSAASPAINKASEQLSGMGLALGIASSLITQLGKDTLGLSDAQAAAAQDAISVTTVFSLLVGNLLQMVTSATANTAAESADTAATTAHTAVVGQSTAAIAAHTAQLTGSKITSQLGGDNGQVPQQSSKLGNAFGGLLATLMILLPVFTYFTSLMQKSTAELQKSLDDYNSKLKEQGSAAINGTGAGGYVDNLKEIAKGRARTQAAKYATTAGVTVGGATAAGVGATTSLTGPFALLASTVSGVAAGLVAFAVVYEEKRKVLEAEAEKTVDTFASLAEGAFSAAASIGDLKKDFAEAGKVLLPENATAEQRTQAEAAARERQAAVVTNQIQSRGGESGIAETQGKSIAILGPIAAKLGKSIDQLTQEDITAGSSGYFGGEISQEDASKASIALLALRNEAEALTETQNKLNEILDVSAQKELDGTKTFDEVMQGNSAFAQNLRNSESIIRAQARARVAELSQSKRLATTAEDRAKIDAEIARVNQEASQDIQDTRNRFRELGDAAIENKKRFEEEQRIRAAIIQTKKAFDKFGAALTSASNQLAQIEQAASNAVAALGTGVIDFSTIAPEDIADFSNVQNAAEKAAEASFTARGLGPVGAALASQVGGAAGVAQKAQAGLVGKQYGPGDVINSEAILASMGIDQATVGPDIFRAIQKKFEEAAQSGQVLDLSAVNEIIAPAVEQGKQAGEQLAKLNAIRNKEIKIYQNFVNQLESQRDKELAAYQKFISVQEKNAEILAKAGVRGAVTRQEREGFRTASAQTALNFAGTGTRAGDVGGNAAILAAAQERKTQLEADVKSGRISEDQAINQQAALNRQIKATTDELSRLADQSAKVSDIQADIEKEQKKRGAVAGIAQDFVFGDKGARESINQGLAGIQAATMTGTVQNQSEEQRKQTLSMLDKLQDVVVGPGGMTGKQVKEQIITQDAARLGLPPEIAQALFDPTSQEEKLQQELIAVTQQQTAAAAALAQQETDNTNRLLTQQAQLIQNIANLNATMQQQGAGVPVYRAFGGRVRGTDTVPAMLTPGEFVMSRPAVESVGIGTLTTMNQGVSSPVMSNGVAYAYMGGAMPSAYRSAGAAAQQREEEELNTPISTKYSQPQKKPSKPFRSGIPHSNLAGARTTGPNGGLVTMGEPGSFMDAIQSDASFGRIPTPTNVAPSAPKVEPLPIRSVADNAVRGKGSGYYARQVASENIKRRRSEKLAKMQSMYGGAQAPQNQMQQSMPAPQMMAAPAQMAGGQNIPAGGNNMVGTMNNIGNQNMSFNHKVDVSGLISLGGLNIDSVASQITNAIAQFVVNKVQQAMRDPTSFRSG